MRRAGWLVIGVFVATACSGSAEAPVRAPFALAGKYLLQTINGGVLPAQIRGDTVVVSDSLILSAGYTFKRYQRVTTVGVTLDLGYTGDFVSTFSAADGITHISMLQGTPTSKTFNFPISSAGVATVVDNSSFTFVYQKQ